MVSNSRKYSVDKSNYQHPIRIRNVSKLFTIVLRQEKTWNHDRDFHCGNQKRQHPYKYRSVIVMENGMTIIELKRSRNRHDTKSAHGIDVFIAFIYIAGHVKDNGKVKKTFWTKVGVADRRKQYQTIGPAVLRNLRHSAASHFLTIQNYPVGLGTKTSNLHILRRLNTSSIWI